MPHWKVGKSRQKRNYYFPGPGGCRRGEQGRERRIDEKPAISYIQGMVRQNLKKLGLAGFLFFLLKGLVWVVLFLLAWSEL